MALSRDIRIAGWASARVDAERAQSEGTLHKTMLRLALEANHGFLDRIEPSVVAGGGAERHRLRTRLCYERAGQPPPGLPSGRVARAGRGRFGCIGPARPCCTPPYDTRACPQPCRRASPTG